VKARYDFFLKKYERGDERAFKKGKVVKNDRRLSRAVVIHTWQAERAAERQTTGESM